VLGVGVNVAHFPKDAEFAATSLKEEGAGEVPVEDVLERFARAFLAWANRWLDDGFAPVRASWLRRARGLGEPIRVRLPNGTVEAKFADLDETGALVLELPEGRRRITAGDVFAL
jgi:BirA family transcriptional regulator, biotin operon repressor / biotin---[acetyl-CoA-carboxylase] ligase